MLLTALGREISRSAPQPSNIRLETAVNLSGRCTRSSAAQPEKANAPISVIVSGRKTLRNACPSAVSAGGSVTKERLASFSSPISAGGASPSAANAFSATAMTGSPSISAGICSSAQRPCSFSALRRPLFFRILFVWTNSLLPLEFSFLSYTLCLSAFAIFSCFLPVHSVHFVYPLSTLFHTVSIIFSLQQTVNFGIKKPSEKEGLRSRNPDFDLIISGLLSEPLQSL